MGNIERSDDDEYVLPPPEPVHPDDVIAHGARWRRERDDARRQLRGAVEETERLRAHYHRLSEERDAYMARAVKAEEQIARLTTSGGQ